MSFVEAADSGLRGARIKPMCDIRATDTLPKHAMKSLEDSNLLLGVYVDKLVGL